MQLEVALHRVVQLAFRRDAHFFCSRFSVTDVFLPQLLLQIGAHFLPGQLRELEVLTLFIEQNHGERPYIERGGRCFVLGGNLEPVGAL